MNYRANGRVNSTLTDPIKITGTDLFLNRLSNIETCPELIKSGFKIRGSRLIKKNLLFFYGIALIMFLVTDYAAAAQTKLQDDPCQGSEAKTDGCFRVWVEVTPAFNKKSPADHTYVKFLEENGKWQSFPCFGACNGGKKLPDTESSTWEDNKKIIQYMADSTLCKWPDHYYLIIGVCHQLANRSLFHTGNIVKNARMYKWSSFVYQTYGEGSGSLEEYSMSNCKGASAKIGTWKPGVPPTCMPYGVEKLKRAEPDAEYRLYMEHFGNQKVTKDVKGMAGLLKSYRDKLMTLHIKQRLGEKNLRDYLPILSRGDDELLKEKKALDVRLLENKRLGADMIDEYNKLFNASLARFRIHMPRKSMSSSSAWPMMRRLMCVCFCRDSKC